MNEVWSYISHWLTEERIFAAVQALLLLIAGFVVAKLLSGALARVLGRYLDHHQTILLRRGVYYLVLILFILSALHSLGFNLSILLGAAGVLSVAIGFASQTSASNLISGLFLIGERPFSVGDVITVGNTTGEVLSIDLLSVKLRTFDNLYVRIPNEQMIKSEVTTLTRFPIRRLDLKIGVAYKEDIARVREVLQTLAERHPLCLDEPAPLFIFLGFGDSSIDLQFSVWAKKENFLDLKNGLQEQIKRAFDEAGIEIPFPHLSLYVGSVTDPLPIRIVHGDGGERPRGD